MSKYFYRGKPQLDEYEYNLRKKELITGIGEKKDFVYMRTPVSDDPFLKALAIRERANRIGRIAVSTQITVTVLCLPLTHSLLIHSFPLFSLSFPLSLLLSVFFIYSAFFLSRFRFCDLSFTTFLSQFS